MHISTSIFSPEVNFVILMGTSWYYHNVSKQIIILVTTHFNDINILVAHLKAFFPVCMIFDKANSLTYGVGNHLAILSLASCSMIR